MCKSCNLIKIASSLKILINFSWADGWQLLFLPIFEGDYGTEREKAQKNDNNSKMKNFLPPQQ
jgi:hypothetical protein